MSLFFFFSSRRRHTRFDCDWSSDVCSSDLGKPAIPLKRQRKRSRGPAPFGGLRTGATVRGNSREGRSEEHTSELQSQSNLVCRLLLEKKKNERAAGKLSGTKKQN